MLGQVTAVGVGLIPVVGQVADVRDPVAAVKGVFESRKSGGAWAGLGMAAVAFLAGVGDALKAEYKAQKLLGKEAKAARSTAGAVAGEAVESAGRGAAASKGGPQILEHPSKSAAVRADEREVGMGRRGARKNLPDQPLRPRPGSRSPMGDGGAGPAHSELASWRDSGPGVSR